MKALQNYIHRLRQEPEAKRRRHALAWSVGITGFVFVLWMINLQSTLSTASGQVAVEQSNSQTSAVTEATTRMGRGWERLQASVLNSWQD